MTSTITDVAQGTQAQSARPRGQGSRRGGGIAGQTQPAQPTPPTPPAPPSHALVPPPSPQPAVARHAPITPTAHPQKMDQIDLTRPIANAVQYRKLLAQYQDDLASLLPKGIALSQWMRSAVNAWARTFNIQSCRAGSILNSLGIGAQMGLHVNGVGGEAWLAAFTNKHLPDDQKEAILLVGYQGMLKLAYQHERVVAVHASCVYRPDHFVFNGGSESFVEHWWDLGAVRQPKDIVGAWASCDLKDSPHPIVVVLDKATIDSWRDTSRDRDSLMWREHQDVGYLKSAVRRLAKLMPKSTALNTALALDERFEKGESFEDLSPLTQPEQSATSRTEGIVAQLKAQTR